MSEKPIFQADATPSADRHSDIALLQPRMIPSALETRNFAFEAILDDDESRSLPAVTLEPHPGNPLTVTLTGHESRARTPGVQSTIYDVISPEGERVGYTVLNQPEERHMGSRKWSIRDILVTDEHRGHGYGPAAYLAVLKSLPEGVGLRTEGVLSPEAVAIWGKLVAKGMAHPYDGGGTPTAFETNI